MSLFSSYVPQVRVNIPLTITLTGPDGHAIMVPVTKIIWFEDISAANKPRIYSRVYLEGGHNIEVYNEATDIQKRIHSFLKAT